MNTSYVLDFSPRGIRLLADGAPQQVLGEVALDDPRRAERLDALCRQAEARAAGVAVTTLWIPPDEILWLSVETGEEAGQSKAAVEALVRAALADRAPGDLVHDWKVAPGGRLEVAAVPRRILREAEEFAVAHGFHPARFAAAAQTGRRFPGHPDFGPSTRPMPRPGGSAAREDGAEAASAAPDRVGRVTAGKPEDRGKPSLDLAVARARRSAGPLGAPVGRSRMEAAAPPALGPARRADPVAANPFARPPQGHAAPIRPDRGEILSGGDLPPRPDPAGRGSLRVPAALGLAAAALVAAGAWAMFAGPSGDPAGIAGERVAATPAAGTPDQAEPPPIPADAQEQTRHAATGLPPGPPAGSDAAEAIRSAAGGVGAGSGLGRIDELAPVSSGHVLLPMAVAEGDEAEEAPGEAVGAVSVAVTAGRPAAVPPPRPAPPGGNVALATAPEAAASLTAATDGEAASETGPGANSPARTPALAERAALAPPPRPGGRIGSATADAREPAAPATAIARPRARPDRPEPEAALAPAEADTAALRADVAATLAAIRPEPAGTGPPAVARSLRPGSRPGDLRGAADGATEPVRVATAAAPEPGPAAMEPADPGTLRLNRMNLIGVYGGQSNRRALVRLPNGRFVKVKVGDRVDGGRVSAIGSEDLQYIKGGRAMSLSMPRG